MSDVLIVLLLLQNLWMTLHEQYGGTLCFPSVVFYVGVPGLSRLALVRTLSFCKTPEGLCGLDTVTRIPTVST